MIGGYFAFVKAIWPRIERRARAGGDADRVTEEHAACAGAWIEPPFGAWPRAARALQPPRPPRGRDVIETTIGRRRAPNRGANGSATETGARGHGLTLPSPRESEADFAQSTLGHA